ncbi:type II toxin-antitoxin system VapC family toxin [candidate division KSB1 bacterium]|nr:type II toxin-antitoxin system VapC family toxin [candidate division KSB1 bacterium]
MICVVDPSVAVEIVLDKAQATYYSEILSDAEWVIAPDLFISEVTNVFWKYNRFENLPLEICEESLSASLKLIDDFIHAKNLYQEALSFACATSHPVYDIMYLVLTRRHSGYLLTLDKQMIQLATNNSIRVMQKK